MLRRLFACIAFLAPAALGVPSGCSFPDYTFTELELSDGGIDASTQGGDGGTAAGATSGSGGASGGTSGGGGMAGAMGGQGAMPQGGMEAGVDGADGAPPGCQSSTDCELEPIRTVCDLTQGVCVECATSTDCEGNLVRKVCDSNACVECVGSSDCVGNVNRQTCDTTRNVCIECATHADCGVGLYCSPAGGCEIGCAVDADCASTRSIPVFDAGAGDGGDASVEAGAPDASGFPDASDDGGSDGGEVPIFLDGGVIACRQNQCVGCVEDYQCPDGTRCVLGRCENACQEPGLPCPAGFSCCDGRCVDLSDDPDFCGACNAPCTLRGSVEACHEGQCVFVSCRTGFSDCNADIADGCEIDTRSNVDHCGQCDSACATPPRGTPACFDSECIVGSCNAPYDDCDGDAANGCEVSVMVSPLNCGACLNECALPNANNTCIGGVCDISNCPSGFFDCDGDPVNGCETDIFSDPANCGTCGFTCALDNAVAACSSGTCTVASCEAPAKDCNNNPIDGCERDTSSDVANCGDCNQGCVLPFATATCSDGECAIESCDVGHEDCDGIVSNGCETITTADENNCGGCGIVCSNNNVLNYECLGGQCVIYNCLNDYADCDDDRANGCETFLLSSVNHCNDCTTVCTAGGGQTPNCVNGGCVTSPCTAPDADCNNDSNDGCEVDTNTDVLHCGGCGNACVLQHATATCNGGSCEVDTCDSGYGDCVAGIAGCETRLTTLTHCGGCNTPCELPNATETCASGTCSVSFCTTPYANCDSSAGNGCEIDTTSNISHCGGCGNACDATNGTPICANGSCLITCDFGFDNCDADVSNGCEAAVRDNPVHCGGCGLSCFVQNGTPGCSGATCTVASCSAPFADCDGLYSSGCETNTNDNESHCGGCGKPCNLPNAVASCVMGTCAIAACAGGFVDCDEDPSNGCEATSCQ